MSDILTLIEPFIVKKKIHNSKLKLTNIEWKLEKIQNCVFCYNLNSEKDLPTLQQRLNEIDTENNLFIFNLDFDFKLLKTGNYVSVNDFLAVQHRVLNQFFKIDFNQKKLIGITGTNGKTTTAHLCVELSEFLGHKAFSVGTLGIRDVTGELDDNLGMTTPPYIYLYKKLFEYFKKYEICFMEVSSHALMQERVYALKFDAAAWCSFSQDHLDYHESMENYFAAKCLLLDKHLKAGTKVFVPKAETDLLKRLTPKYKEVEASLTLAERGFTENELPLFFKVQYNRSNLELACSLNQLVWNKKIESKNLNLSKLKLPEGRFITFQAQKRTAIVDFAHTPEALENICKAITQTFTDKKLVVLFGCGGNRDKTKRPKMGKVAATFAHLVYVTSDNPRFEKPQDIIQDILTGIEDRTKVKVIEDRKMAVEKAFSDLQEDEILLLAGKGHENYIIINDVKHTYSDLGTLHEITNKLGLN